MGKYMRKAKFTDDVAVMEVPQSTLGVRTRAKTLALQRLHSSTNPPPSPVSASASASDAALSDSSCYLQLRSRRLEKPFHLKPQTHKPSSQNKSCGQEAERNTDSNPRSGSRLGLNDSASSVSVKSRSITRSKGEEDCLGNRVADETEEGLEASFGENNLDFQARERSTRENTPCSYIREVEVVAPGSSTRQRTSEAANWRSQNAILRHIPSAYEMDEFFRNAEQQQQQQFIEKYNFDIVTDMPLPGRYEWVSVSQ